MAVENLPQSKENGDVNIRCTIRNKSSAEPMKLTPATTYLTGYASEAYGILPFENT